MARKGLVFHRVGCQVFFDHQRHFEDDGVVKLPQIQTGEFLIFSRRYTNVLRWTNSLRLVSDTFKLFSKNRWMVNRVS